MSHPSIHTIDCGTIGSDGGSVFGTVPRVLWQKWVRADENNKITSALRNLLIIDGSRHILVDTGIGHVHLDERFIKRHRPSTTNFKLARALAAFDLKPEQITDVVLTHLHYDHSGGLITIQDGRITPAFPNAQVWLQRSQWEWALNPSEKDRAGFVPEHFQWLQGDSRLELLDGPGQLTGSMELLVFDGHTPGMQCPLIHQKETPVFYTGDLIAHRHHTHLPVIMAYDLEPLKSLAEKKAILSRALAEGWTLLFQHDPDLVAGKAVLEKDRFRVEPGSFETASSHH